MSFTDEWASIKAKVIAESEAKTNLAGIAPEYDSKGALLRPEAPGGGGGSATANITVNTQELRKRAARTEKVRGNLKTADNKAVSSVEPAARGLKGFETQESLRAFRERWVRQVKYLDGLLDSSANGMRQAAIEFEMADEKQRKKLQGEGKK